MAVRGIRGAITVNENKSADVLAATRELLLEIIKQNNLKAQDIASIIFTVTDDINSTFPAEAARAMGLNLVPLMCGREIGVEGALPLCIRILLHVNTDKTQEQIKHVFLKGASKLREDLINK